MKKTLLWIALTQLTTVAMATYDSEGPCESAWSPFQNICSPVSFLDPGNDSRVNLGLLLVDRGFLSLTAPKEEAISEYSVPFPVYLNNSHLESLKPALTSKVELDETQLIKLGVNKKTDHIEASTYISGQGTRCVSNQEASAQSFISQLITTELPQTERRSLAQSRIDLLSACDWTAPLLKNILPGNIKTVSGKQFLTYLRAVGDFYSGRFEEAHRDFSSLTNSTQPWLKETAIYMVARNQLNKAQKYAFDDYAWILYEKVDKSSLRFAEEGFNRYLVAYPAGLYTASAKGLMERVYWLDRSSPKLAEYYASQLNQLHPEGYNESVNKLINNIDSRVLMDEDRRIEDPILLATRDLVLMRKTPKLTRNTLESQKEFFTKEPRLYQFLQAAFEFYVEENWDAALQRLTTRGPNTSDYLWFSEQMLAGKSLEAKKDWQSAEKLWIQLQTRVVQPLQRQQTELALAVNYEKSRRLAKVFAPGSPVQSKHFREILLTNSADANLLRQQSKSGANEGERKKALEVLLRKEITRGRYGDFVNDVKEFDQTGSGDLDQYRSSMEKDNYKCPSMVEVAAILARDQENPKGLNCLGEFIRNNTDEVARKDSAGDYLGGAPSFEGQVFSRLQGYKRVINNPKAPVNDTAFALFRAIHCFATTGYNSCDDTKVDITVRKAWFVRLKTKYGNTIWGKSIKYYW